MKTHDVIVFLTTIIVVAAAATSTATATMVHDNPFGLERSVNVSGSTGCSNIQWTVDKADRQWTVAFRSTPGADYVGLGLSENGGMKGADIMLVKRKHVHSDDEFVVHDMYSLDFVPPQDDVLQNVELLQAYEDDDGCIQVLLRRKLDTCDKDDFAVEARRQHLICASGSMDEDGHILYHGSNRGKVSVNLVLDTDLLYRERFAVPANATRTVVSPGVAVHGDPVTAVQPYPVDVQMRNITLDPTQTTSYRCSEFTMPDDVRYRGYQVVWGEGITADVEPMPFHIHHAHIYRCDDNEFLDPSTFDGHSYDCLDMPPCEFVAGITNLGEIRTLPTNVHFPIKKGRYILNVHYENPYGERIENDQAGIRFWVEPNSLTSRTTEGQMIITSATYSSILIPADSDETEYDLEYQISADATRAMLPVNGVDIFACTLHMHERGVRGQVKVIRNGVHIYDIIKSQGHDHNQETIEEGNWKLLPGDALIVTCTYRPLPDRDIVGGPAATDEMCVFGAGVVPGIPNFAYAVGYMVRPNKPFLNSYAGPAIGNYLTLDYSKASYAANPPSRTFVSLSDHEVGFCDITIREELEFMPLIQFSSPEVVAQIVLAGAFAFCSLLAQWKPIRRMDDERKQRNTIIAAGQLVFGTIALPFLLICLVEIWPAETTYDATNFDSFTVERFFVTAQALLFLAELFYRITPRWEVIMHHLLTSFLVTFVFVAFDRTFSLVVLKVGLALTLMGVTEQPLYLALLFKNFGYATTWWWPKLCRFSAYSFVITKLILIGLVLASLAQSATKKDASWIVTNHSFSDWKHNTISREAFTAVIVVSLFPLLFSQVFISNVMFQMARKYEQKTLKSSKMKRAVRGLESDVGCLDSDAKEPKEDAFRSSETEIVFFSESAFSCRTAGPDEVGDSTNSSTDA